MIQLDDDDVPSGKLETFDRIRDPLIAKPLIIMGEIVPRDLDSQEARAIAQAILDLLVDEVSGA